MKNIIMKLIKQYGWQEFLETLREILEDEAVHFTDNGDSEGREAWDVAAESIGDLLAGELPQE